MTTDLLRIIARVLFTYVAVLALLRVSGKRSVKQGDMASFVVALIIGDMFDDVFWAEVEAARFVVGVGTLVLLHVVVGLDAWRRGGRHFRSAFRAAGGTR